MRLYIAVNFIILNENNKDRMRISYEYTPFCCISSPEWDLTPTRIKQQGLRI